MITHTMTSQIALGLFLGMWVCYELGRWEGVRELRNDPDRLKTGTGVIEAAVFGLMGLLLAFAFAGAAGRYDTRRAQIAQEANAIGTAWLRIDLLPQAHQDKLRDLFRRYLDARIEVYQKIPDMVATADALNRANQLQGEIWKSAVAAGQESPTPATNMLMLPALNDMIDITTTRTESAKTHMPTVIFCLLCAVALLSAVLVGYGTSDRPRRLVYVLVFIISVTVTIYVILDLEFPRVGWIRLSDADQVLVELRKSMN
jgi:hypothetical protein